MFMIIFYTKREDKNIKFKYRLKRVYNYKTIV